MQDIAYKQKYLKYKSKYLELKRGGGKKLKFAEIKKKFDEIISAGKKLYFEDTKNEIRKISQEKYKKSVRSSKDNYYLVIE
jgi:hypothetical protein